MCIVLFCFYFLICFNLIFRIYIFSAITSYAINNREWFQCISPIKSMPLSCANAKTHLHSFVHDETRETNFHVAGFGCASASASVCVCVSVSLFYRFLWWKNIIFYDIVVKQTLSLSECVCVCRLGKGFISLQ